MLNVTTLPYVPVSGEQLGRAIASAREAAGLTKAEVARRYGADPAVIGRFEEGSQLPTLPKLDRLCEVLGVDMGDLLADAGIIRAPRSVRHAIENDKTLPEHLRRSVLSTYDHMQSIQRGLVATDGG
jgi:transcriptional regulator with XRE-family HTH domain